MTTAQARTIQRAWSLTKNERADSEESRPLLWLLVQLLFRGPIGHIKWRVLALGPIITLPVLTVRHTSGRISASHRSVKAESFDAQQVHKAPFLSDIASFGITVAEAIALDRTLAQSHVMCFWARWARAPHGLRSQCVGRPAHWRHLQRSKVRKKSQSWLCRGQLWSWVSVQVKS